MAGCFIVGAGDFAKERFSPAAGDMIIAADAGCAHLESIGVKPHFVVGDFDSLGYTPDYPEVQTLPVEKNDTDMAVALDRALSMGQRRILIFGGVGGRLDHTLGNLSLIAAASRRGAAAYLMASDWTAAAVTGGEMRFSGGYRGGYSVFCVGERAEGVYERGCKYPLHSAEMSCFNTLGLSNEFMGGESAVSVSRGTLIVYWQGNLALPLPEISFLPDNKGD